MENIRIAEISIAVTRKTVKNFNLKVRIRDGTVAMSMPAAASLSEARAFAASKLDWLRRCRCAAAWNGRADCRPCRTSGPDHLPMKTARNAGFGGGVFV